MKNLKYVLAAVFFTVAFAAFSAVTATLEPHRITAGVPAQPQLNSDEGGIPDFRMGTPNVKGLVWLGSGTQSTTRIVNGRFSRFGTRVYTFVVEKPGKYVIPSVEVRAGGKVYKIRRIEFTAASPQVRQQEESASGGQLQSSSSAGRPSENLKDLLYARMNVPEGRRNFYVGEEIPLEVNLFIASGIRPQLSYPEITVPGGKPAIFFHDYRNFNRENPHFEMPGSRPVVVKNRRFTEYRFKTGIRTMDPGTLHLHAAIRTTVPVQSRGRARDPFFDDDFFSGFFGSTQRVRYTVSAALPGEITVRALPQQDPRSQFLGLIGDWGLRISLSSDKAKAGDALTLSITVQGTGTTETLHAPKFEFPGFRIYSPEIDRPGNGHRAVIKYILIPVQAGKREIGFTVSTFDPETGKYNNSVFRKTVTVTPSSAVLQAAPPPSAGIQKTEQTEEPEKRTVVTSLLYLKKGADLDKQVQQPYFRNTLIFCILVLIAGLGSRAICELIHLRKKACENDPRFRRKEQAKRTKSKLIRLLRKTQPAQIAEKETEITEYVSSAMGLPPGATLNDAADRTEDGELKEALQELVRVSWLPGGTTGFSEELKNKLIRGLSRLVCFAVIFSALFSANAAEKAVRSEQAAMAAYDSGDFRPALQYYTSRLRKTAPSAALLYNIGNCRYQLGEYASALAEYERAMRLAPRDTDIPENLNLTRRKLGLPEKYRIETPGNIPGYLRDLLRPDEWLLLISIGLALLLTGDGFRRLTFRRIWMILTGLGLLLTVSGTAAVLSQRVWSYAENAAVITSPCRIRLRALPSGKAPELETILSPGEDVRIEETRNHWVRVRSGESEGWLPESTLSGISR